MEFIRRVYENSKVTIPKEIRDLHGIEEGDYVKFQVMEVISPRRERRLAVEEVERE